jgi:hypothetical protein
MKAKIMKGKDKFETQRKFSTSSLLEHIPRANEQRFLFFAKNVSQNMEQDETDCNFIGNPKNAKFRFESFHNTKRIGCLLRIIAKQKVNKISFQRNRKKAKNTFSNQLAKQKESEFCYESLRKKK